MKLAKTILPVSVVALFLGLALMPAASAEEISTQDLTLEIGYKASLKEGYFFKKLVVTEQQLEAFNVNWLNWEEFVKEVRADERMDLNELARFIEKTVALVEEIKEMTKDPETGEYHFPDINIFSFIEGHLFKRTKAFGGSKIFTIGRGRAWLPFNRQGETFIGMRFLPIVIQHTLGFSKVTRINIFPPSYGIEDRLFVHNLLTFGFVGLYINFGERYLDRPAGPVLLVGRSLGLRLGEDIP